MRITLAPRVVAAVLAVVVLGAVAPALAQTATVEISVDSSGGSTRLVLTHSQQLVYAIRVEDNRLAIVYAQPVRVEPTDRRRFDDPILERYRLQGGDTLVLDTGPGYRGYESFELRNPFRLILDLQGTRGEREVLQPLPTRDPGKTIIVIDPGHGGIESGAVGPTGLQEKEVTLDLARRLRRALKRNRSLDVVLTRDEDRLLGLDERTAIANHNHADLFVSIHLNSSPRTTATGAETYFLSTDATDDEARTLAALENRASGASEDALGGDDVTRRNLDLVLWDLAQNQYLAESSMLAESIQQELNRLTGTRDRGVRQAPFRVLMGATMPAVLVEAGFISNPDEEARFRSFDYRNSVVDAMAAAVRNYVGKLQRLSGPGASTAPAASRP